MLRPGKARGNRHATYWPESRTKPWIRRRNLVPVPSQAELRSCFALDELSGPAPRQNAMPETRPMNPASSPWDSFVSSPETSQTSSMSMRTPIKDAPTQTDAQLRNFRARSRRTKEARPELLRGMRWAWPLRRSRPFQSADWRAMAHGPEISAP